MISVISDITLDIGQGDITISISQQGAQRVLPLAGGGARLTAEKLLRPFAALPTVAGFSAAPFTGHETGTSGRMLIVPTVEAYSFGPLASLQRSEDISARFQLCQRLLE